MAEAVVPGIFRFLRRSLVTYHAISTETTDKMKTNTSKATIAFWAKGESKSTKFAPLHLKLLILWLQRQKQKSGMRLRSDGYKASVQETYRRKNAVVCD
jgi:hypothetical protein